MTLSISNNDFDMTGGHPVHVDSSSKVAYPTFISVQTKNLMFVKVGC